MRDHIALDNHETHALLRCLLRAAAVGESTGNLDLLGRLIIDKWFPKGDADR